MTAVTSQTTQSELTSCAVSALITLRHTMESIAFRQDGDDAIVFVSLGMLVLDELRFPSSPTLYDVVGGSGAYSE